MSEFEVATVTTKLVNLGFTQLESDVYLYLLMNREATGYAIGKGINKATANVYKALESLINKGAVSYASSGSKICIAVPWKQFLSSKKKLYLSNMDSLSKQLEKLPKQRETERIHQISNASQVLEQSIQMIEAAESILLMDLQPGIVDKLKPSIAKAIANGVEVRAKVYEKADIPGVVLTLRKKGKAVYGKTQDVEFTICADGKNFIVGLLTPDLSEVLQALQSKCSLMNMKIYSGLLYELVLTDLKRLIPTDNLNEAKKLLIDTEHLHPFSNENIVFQEYKERYKSET